MEDANVPKVWWDVKMDSDALFGQFGVLLAGIIDLQLMEHASRSSCRYRLKSLANALDELGTVDGSVMRIKKEGKRLFLGGYGVFNERPLRQALIDYCVVDVAYMPELSNKYNAQLGNKVSLMAYGTA